MPKDNVQLVEGRDGYDALSLGAEATVKYPFQMALPSKLNDFMVAGVLKTDWLDGGYIFTVMDPTETIIQLGVHLSAVVDDLANITLYYTDVTHKVRESQPLATFEIPYPASWFSFAFKVMYDELVFYYECEERGALNIVRDPAELAFNKVSVLYIGQAGDKLKGNFQVSQTLFGIFR